MTLQERHIINKSENNMLEALGLGSIGGGIIVSKLIDYFVPFSRTPQGKLFKEEKKWQNIFFKRNRSGVIIENMLNFFIK